MVKQYIEICEKKGIIPQTDTFAFSLKINNKNIYTETVQKTTIEQLLKNGLTSTLDEDLITDNDLINKSVINSFLIHGSSCGTLKTASYTGYGKFDFVMTINDVIVRNDECDLYHSLDGINSVLSRDKSLGAGTRYCELDDYGREVEIPLFDIWSYNHGGEG